MTGLLTQHPAARSRGQRTTGTARPWAVRICRAIGSRLARIMFRLEVTGSEHVPVTGAVLLASNHSGLLDGPLVFLLAPRPAVFLTKAEMFVGPGARVFGWLGCLPVHRGRPDRSALRAGLAALAEGKALGVFPEGTRGTGRLDTMADGLAYLALRSGAAVVPVAVSGTAAALPRGRVVPRLRVPVQVSFGRPFKVHTDGDPRVRGVLRKAGEELRLGLRAHLASSSPEPS